MSAADTTPEAVTRRGEVKPLPATKTPLGPGTISALGLLWSVLLLGVGVLGVQAALGAAGVLTGTSWLTWVIQRVDGLTPAGWMLPAGLVLGLVGLWLLATGLRPRPRTGVPSPRRAGCS